MESMTGYGASERGNLRIEVRSLNHRFLEINFRMNPLFYPSEPRMRERVKSRFSRGKIDIIITVTEPPSNYKLNRQLLLNLIEELRGVEPQGLSLVLNLRDVLTEVPYNYDENELLELLDEAMSNLKSMRLEEGEILKREIQGRIEKIDRINDKIKSLQNQVFEEGRRKLKERLREVFKEFNIDSISEERKEEILQFLLSSPGIVTSVLERMDIAEEIERIESHISQFKKAMEFKEAVGKRLDFIIQEILREFNTIGAKSTNSELRTLVIEAKTEIERLREQVQNIE
ncbi:MAG: YicC family protein [Thermodesulfovibrionales bacterium]|nr:YicC family protein [Thermodesulfovibrionales bacterium]